MAIAVALALLDAAARGQPLRSGGQELLANLPDHRLFDLILQASVIDERVDYALIREKYREALDVYLQYLATIDAMHLAPKEQLAFYINLYNATVIKAVVDRYKPDYSISEDDFSALKERLVRIGKRTISLNELETHVIRARFRDPRVHAALVRAARSSPPLLNRAYTGDDLNQVVDANMERFINDRTRNPIDEKTKQLKLSRLFESYAADFGGLQSIADYVGGIACKDYSGYTLSFVDFSWDLNAAVARAQENHGERK